jgi:CBS domain containing-hemolysin-like protein
MSISGIYLLALVLLLLLNAFFVFAEFALVKIRSTQIDAMADEGRPEAGLLKRIHDRMDEYLSVCQLGITFASIGLGFVGEPAVARMLEPLLGHGPSSHVIAITISYIFVSFMHILFGEQVPKIMAIRIPERAALATALPMRIFHLVFYPALWLLNTSANAVLRMLKLPPITAEEAPSEVEVKIILERSQQQGLMSFRRLLLMENVFDFGDLKVRDVMEPADRVVALGVDAPWEENVKHLTEKRFSRYPVRGPGGGEIVGFVHVKDLLKPGTGWPGPVDLAAMLRPTIRVSPDRLVEDLLPEMRNRRVHMAMVTGPDGALLGLVTMEDILEQLVGAIEDEFEQGPTLSLASCLKDNRVVLDVRAERADQAIREIVERSREFEIAEVREAVIQALLAREKSMSTYLGKGTAVPHARLENLPGTMLFIGRSAGGVRFGEATGERAHLLFVLLTPAAVPRAQVRMLARIVGLRESEYVWDRLMEARKPAEALDIVRSGDEMQTT